MPDFDLRDAMALMKAGDHAGAQRMMNQIVGLPANTPLDKSASTPPPSAKDAIQPGMMRGKPMPAGPAMTPAAQGGAPTPGQFRAAANAARMRNRPPMGGRPFAKGGSVGSASKRADGCAQRGKTKGKMIWKHKMAYGKDPSVEVKSLAKRYPKKGIDPTIPEGIREQLIEMEKERERKKMGEAYDRSMPSPEPGESTVRKAKGGSVSSASKRADGCVQRGKTKGKMV